jgi:hypothetical protein
MAFSDPDDEGPLDPAAERLRRKLARLLFVSGGVMLLGFIAVFAAIVYKLGLLGESGSLSAGSEPVDARIALPAGARLLSADLDGARALLTVEARDGGRSLLLVELESGRILGRYAVAPE